MSFAFASPLWLLLLLPLAGGYWWLGRRPKPYFSMPVPQAYKAQVTWRSLLSPFLPLFSWIALAALVVAMARPQSLWQEEKVKADGLDIALALDISPSMLSKDFTPDRLSVAKRVAIDFIKKRPYDRLAVVAFSAEAFTQCPLTTDHTVVEELLQTLEVGRLEDGTAIGMGLATALNRLKDSESPSKIAILLTDGENNAGYIAPMQAAELASDLKVRVYTIGIGTEGIVMSPSSRNFDGSYNFSPRRTTFDTQLLEDIAKATGGRFFRARSSADLEGIYADIDKMEKTEVEISTVQRESDWYGYLVVFALVLLVAEALLRWVVMRSVWG